MEIKIHNVDIIIESTKKLKCINNKFKENKIQLLQDEHMGLKYKLKMVCDRI